MSGGRHIVRHIERRAGDHGFQSRKYRVSRIGRLLCLLHQWFAIVSSHFRKLMIALNDTQWLCSCDSLL